MENNRKKINLVLPCAGESSRFPGTRPKWMLTQPDGQLMVTTAISKIDTSSVDNIYVVVLKKHIQEYSCEDGIRKAFEDQGLGDKTQIIVLDNPTGSQPETIYNAIKQGGIEGSIFIKDCDGQFRASVSGRNEVCIHDLSRMHLVHAANKSYVICDEHNIVTNIAEKNIISSKFCVGGYSFDSAKHFSDYYEKMKDYKDLYVSHIIYQMMLDGHKFSVQEISEYVDWGTLSEWSLFKSEHATLFVDIDGVLVKNSGQYFSPVWGETDGIEKNIASLNDLYDSGKVQVILTTARKEKYSKVTEDQLKREGVKYHRIIYGMLHAKRIIINDYAKTNPYKSCDAINLSRNSDSLGEKIKDCIKSYQK